MKVLDRQEEFAGGTYNEGIPRYIYIKSMADSSDETENSSRQQHRDEAESPWRKKFAEGTYWHDGDGRTVFGLETLLSDGRGKDQYKRKFRDGGKEEAEDWLINTYIECRTDGFTRSETPENPSAENSKYRTQESHSRKVVESSNSSRTSSLTNPSSEGNSKAGGGGTNKVSLGSFASGSLATESSSNGCIDLPLTEREKDLLDHYVSIYIWPDIKFVITASLEMKELEDLPISFKNTFDFLGVRNRYRQTILKGSVRKLIQEKVADRRASSVKKLQYRFKKTRDEEGKMGWMDE